MNQSIKYTYNVDGDNFMSAGEASTDLKRVLRQLGLNNDLVRRVGIAMYEGEINMVIHARGGQVDVEIFPDRIELALKDQGPGIPDVDRAMEKGYSTAPDQIRALGFGAGMGLPNMQKYSDHMHIETTLGVGTNVYMTFLIA